MILLATEKGNLILRDEKNKRCWSLPDLDPRLISNAGFVAMWSWEETYRHIPLPTKHASVEQEADMIKKCPWLKELLTPRFGYKLIEHGVKGL